MTYGKALNFRGTRFPRIWFERRPDMTDDGTSAQPLPPAETLAVAQTTILMLTAHRADASGWQWAMHRIMVFVGWPGFAALLFLAIMA